MGIIMKVYESTLELNNFHPPIVRVERVKGGQNSHFALFDPSRVRGLVRWDNILAMSHRPSI
jgi:hypothetical protein